MYINQIISTTIKDRYTHKTLELVNVRAALRSSLWVLSICYIQSVYCILYIYGWMDRIRLFLGACLSHHYLYIPDRINIYFLDWNNGSGAWNTKYKNEYPTHCISYTLNIRSPKNTIHLYKSNCSRTIFKPTSFSPLPITSPPPPLRPI